MGASLTRARTSEGPWCLEQEGDSLRGVSGQVLCTLAEPAPTPVAPRVPSSSTLVLTSVPENKGFVLC